MNAQILIIKTATTTTTDHQAVDAHGLTPRLKNIFLSSSMPMNIMQNPSGIK